MIITAKRRRGGVIIYPAIMLASEAALVQVVTTHISHYAFVRCLPPRYLNMAAPESSVPNRTSNLKSTEKWPASMLAFRTVFRAVARRS